MTTNNLNDIFSIKKPYDLITMDFIVPDIYKQIRFPDKYSNGTDNYLVLFDVHDFHTRELTQIITYNIITQNEYTMTINIWNYEEDYWFRHGIINNMICLLDYTGLKIYNMELELLYFFNDSTIYDTNTQDHQLQFENNYFKLIAMPSKQILHEFTIID